MGPNLRKFREMSNQPFFKGEKSLDMGRAFRPRTAYPFKKIIRVPPPPRMSKALYKVKERVDLPRNLNLVQQI